jgi:hypothetical protein
VGAVGCGVVVGGVVGGPAVHVQSEASSTAAAATRIVVLYGVTVPGWVNNLLVRVYRAGFMS